MKNNNFNIGDKIYCIEEVKIATSNVLNKKTNKIEPNFILKFQKNKTYIILDKQKNYNLSYFYYIIDNYNIPQMFTSYDISQAFLSKQEYRKQKLLKICGHNI